MAFWFTNNILTEWLHSFSLSRFLYVSFTSTFLIFILQQNVCLASSSFLFNSYGRGGRGGRGRIFLLSGASSAAWNFIYFSRWIYLLSQRKNDSLVEKHISEMTSTVLAQITDELSTNLSSDRELYLLKSAHRIIDKNLTVNVLTDRNDTVSFLNSIRKNYKKIIKIEFWRMISFFAVPPLRTSVNEYHI